MESPRAVGLCSITILLGAALLLLAPGSTQALSKQKGLPRDQDVDNKIILGAVKPGEKAWHPLQVQEGPEEDRDHLYHPQDTARQADVRELAWMPTPEVQNGPEEDRDHLYHS